MIKRALQELDHSLFRYGSPVTFGAFRILFGTMVLVNLLFVLKDFGSFFSEKGFVPLSAAQTWNGNEIPTISPLMHTTDDTLSLVFYGLVVLVAITSVLGLWTRVSTILLYVGIVSLHQRNPIILHGGDTLMRCGVLAMALAPSGAACSLDRWLKLRKGDTKPSPEVSLWPQRLLQYQWAMLYFMTAFAKSFGSMWRDGTATWYPVHLTEFQRFPFPAFLDTQPFIALSTYGTLLIEVALATLVFAKPYRKWVLLGGLLLHGGIEYRMNIPLFAFIICSGYVVFYDGEEITEWAGRMVKRFPRLKPIFFPYQEYATS